MDSGVGYENCSERCIAFCELICFEEENKKINYDLSSSMHFFLFI
jgi:hypothetical protein